MEALDDENKHPMAIPYLVGSKGASLRFRCKRIVEGSGHLSLIPALRDCRQGLSHLSVTVFEGEPSYLPVGIPLWL